MKMTSAYRMALAAALIVGAAGCGGSSATTNNNNNVTSGLASYISRVATVSGTSATLRTGSPTASGGPAITLDGGGGTSANLPGGSRQFTVNSTTAFTTVAVYVQSIDGYYEISGLPSGTSAQIVVTFAQNASGAFTMGVAAGAGTGFGTAQTFPVAMTVVGTGAIQVNVSWTTAADVDLHVVDPSGEEIYYGHRSSASGGQLDLDSNAACGGNDTRAENITWPTSGAPRGTYIVRVDYWSACGASSTPYTVTAQVAGQDVRVQNGTFTGEGDYGGAGSGTTIWTFTY
jgi:uncharacterized protein YaiE (UPF0345 family)